MRKWVMLLAILNAVLLPAGAQPVINDEDVDAALENPTLRSYFRREALDSRAFIGPDGRVYYRRDYFLEERVDRMIREFIGKLAERRRRVSATVGAVTGARLRLQRHPDDPRTRRLVGESLKRLEDRLKELRSTVSPLMEGLESKTSPQPRITEPFEDKLFDQQLKALQEKISTADRQIEEYFFKPTHTVDVSQLGEGNALILLFKAQGSARELARWIESSR